MSRRLFNALPPVVLGLAACSVVVFALGQSYFVLDLSGLDRWRPLDSLLRAGNVALTILLAIAGYGATRQLVAARARGVRACLGVVLWYALGLTALLGLVVGTVWLLNGADGTDPVSAEQTRTSALQVLTYQWNTYVAAHPLSVRTDLAPLWYFSVEFQLVLVALLAVLVLGRRPTVLAAVASLAAVGSWWFRFDLLLADGWFTTSLNTAARADAFLLGMAAAAVAHGRRLGGNLAAGVGGGAVLVLVGCVIATTYVEVQEFLRIQGPLVAVVTALFLVSVSHRLDDRTLVVEALTTPELVSVGSAWRVVLAWTVPAFVFVGRHLAESPGIFRIACSALVLAGLAVGTMALRSVALQQLRREYDRVRGTHAASADSSAT